MRTTFAQLDMHLDKLIALHKECFPSDVMPEWGVGSWWIVWDKGVAVAFIGIEDVPSWTHTAYISRVGVVDAYRGRGIQQFLMEKVCKAAIGSFKRIISSTYENPASANNFIKCKFKTYVPTTPWGAAGTIYWIKEL